MPSVGRIVYALLMASIDLTPRILGYRLKKLHHPVFSSITINPEADYFS
jgi:hypothetical protein